MRMSVAETNTKGITYKTPATKDSTEEVDTDSDYESGFTEPEAGTGADNEEKRAVLSPGSHST